MSGARELYRSPNGDCWYIARDPANAQGYVIHEPNAASGGQRTRIEVSAFLSGDAGAPEQQALLRLIGTLAEGAPDSSGAGAVEKISVTRER